MWFSNTLSATALNKLIDSQLPKNTLFSWLIFVITAPEDYPGKTLGIFGVLDFTDYRLLMRLNRTRALKSFVTCLG